MREAIGAILPLAVGVALSPVPIVAVVLMLATPSGRTNGIAFVAGWVVGLAVAGTIVLLVSGGANASDGGDPATWVGVVKLVLGLLLLALGVHRWRGRPRGDEVAELPGWMKTIDTFTAVKSLGLGVVASAINPKNLALVIAAATAIAATGISSGDEAVAMAVFVVLATVGVGLPLALYLVMGARSKPILDGLREWMAHNNAAIMAVLILVFGFKFIGDGIAAL
jgi:threonine/homoserine/homoserine lactone efflux protein